jgi:O-antigen ligase
MVFKGSPWADHLFFALAAFTGVLCFFRKINRPIESSAIPQMKFVYFLVIAYTLSEAQYFWITGTFSVFLFWAKKVLIFYIILNETKTVAQLKRLLWAVVFAGTFLIFFGWNLYFEHPEFMFHENRLQAGGNYNLSNSFAFFLSIIFPMAFAVLEITKKFSAKIFMFGFLLITIVSSLYTRSRAGTLSLMISLCLSLLFSERILRNRILKIFSIALITITFASVGVLIVLGGRSDATSFLGGGGEASSGDRLLAWVSGIRMFLDHPFLGVGWSKFPEYIRDYGHDKKLLAHNTFISVMAETGIFGFFCFTAIIFISLKQLLVMRRFWKEKTVENELLTLCNGVLVSLIIFILNSSFSVKDHDPIYWTVLTFTAILTQFYNDSTKRNKGSTSKGGGFEITPKRG